MVIELGDSVLLTEATNVGPFSRNFESVFVWMIIFHQFWIQACLLLFHWIMLNTVPSLKKYIYIIQMVNFVILCFTL